MIASQNGHVEVVDTLLQHGASVDLKDKVHLFAVIYNKSFYYILFEAAAMYYFNIRPYIMQCFPQDKRKGGGELSGCTECESLSGRLVHVKTPFKV